MQLLFCFVKTLLVNPCTNTHFNVRGETNPSSALLILSAHSSHHLPSASMSHVPQHLQHWSWGTHQGFAGDHQVLVAR